MNTLDALIGNLSRLPGIGKKSAARMAYYLLKADPGFAEKLGCQITELRAKVKTCSLCGGYTDSDPCELCQDPRRDHGLVCVVEQAQDVQPILQTNEYPGVFHVLQGVLSPLEGVGPENLTINKLIQRVRDEKIREVILATNPTVEGDTTALYLVKLLKEYPVKITRLASGIPVGGDLEFADRLTLARSLKGRTDFSL
ncbi:MAG: recombination mediator RecR [Spirochaetales bacterium]|jgi:recombination protein RecR|nr:recombination mediator RecR [Spirochaetales bacterium]